MTTLQQHTLARLRAEAEARMAEQTRIAEEWREHQRGIAKRNSDLAEAGDLIIGVISGIGLSALIVLAIWAVL